MIKLVGGKYEESNAKEKSSIISSEENILKIIQKIYKDFKNTSSMF